MRNCLNSALRLRLQPRDEDGKAVEGFSDVSKKVIEKLHKVFQTADARELTIPRDIEDRLADFGVRKETLKSNRIEDVL